jgi:translation initiation factor 2 gamma subunit (eIF-2gamma)
LGVEATLAAVATTNLTDFNKRQRYTSLLDYDGHTVLTATIAAGATATALRGRFYWKGILVEDTTS